MVFPVELNGSLGAATGSVALEVKGSGPAVGAAATSPGFVANRSGSGTPAVGPNGSAELAVNGSSGAKGAPGAWKKESAAKGSEPLNGSPPNGSDYTETATDTKY